MDAQSHIRQTADQLPKQAGLKGLFLGGSHGKGTADAVSDIDFVGIADPSDHQAIAKHWRETLNAADPVIFWRARIGAHSLINVITESWVRLDLILTPPDAFKARVRSALKPLHDPSDLYSGLAAEAPAHETSPARVTGMVEEFFRVLGMAPVVLTRNELVTMAWGTSILRDLLRDVMLEDCPLSDRGGAMHLSTLLSKDDMATLNTLPYPGPNRADLIDAQEKIAAVFLPRARALADRVGADWPEAMESATKAHLRATHGIEITG